MTRPLISIWAEVSVLCEKCVVNESIAINVYARDSRTTQNSCFHLQMYLSGSSNAITLG